MHKKFVWNKVENVCKKREYSITEARILWEAFHVEFQDFYVILVCHRKKGIKAWITCYSYRKEEQRVAYQKTPTWWIMQYCPLNRGKGKCSICGKNNWELFLKRQIFCSLIPCIRGQLLEILSKDHGVILSSQINFYMVASFETWDQYEQLEKCELKENDECWYLLSSQKYICTDGLNFSVIKLSQSIYCHKNIITNSSHKKKPRVTVVRYFLPWKECFLSNCIFTLGYYDMFFLWQENNLVVKC